MSLWSFAYFEMNEFVPVSFATIRALDVIPGVSGIPPMPALAPIIQPIFSNEV